MSPYHIKHVKPHATRRLVSSIQILSKYGAEPEMISKSYNETSVSSFRNKAAPFLTKGYEHMFNSTLLS